MEVYQQQIEMEKLNHQGELMLKKAIDDTDRDIIKGPITELKHLWENLGEKITHRQVGSEFIGMLYLDMLSIISANFVSMYQ